MINWGWISKQSFDKQMESLRAEIKALKQEPVIHLHKQEVFINDKLLQQLVKDFQTQTIELVDYLSGRLRFIEQSHATVRTKMFEIDADQAAKPAGGANG